MLRCIKEGSQTRLKTLGLILLSLILLGAGPSMLTPSAQYRGFLSVGGPGSSNPPGGLLVIRDQKGLDAFISRIPPEQITPTRPAPPSDDPLLAHPRIDFGKSMVLVAYSGSMLTSVEILEIRAEGNSTRVSVKREPVKEMSSVPLGVGRYHCVVVDRREGPVSE